MTIEQLGLTEKQEDAVRLRLKGVGLESIGQQLNIKKSAVSRLLSRAHATAAAAGVSLFVRQRVIRPRSLTAYRGV